MFITAKRRMKEIMACLLFIAIFLVQGCPLVAVAIFAAYDDDEVVVTAEVPRSASVVFAAAMKRVEKGVSETGIPYNVVRVDEDNYSIFIEGTDGSWRGNFVVIPVGARVSQIIGQGTDDLRAKDESEHLILLGIENLCKDLGVEYTVITRHLNDENSVE